MKLKRVIHDSGPQILVGVGIAGFIGAMILAVRATPKANEALEELEDPTTTEKVKVLVPHYAPAIGAAAFATGMILMNNHILTSRAAGMLAMYTFAEEALRKWQDSAEQKVSKKVFEEIRQEATKAPEDPPYEIGPDQQLIWIWDEWTSKYFTVRSIEDINAAVNRVNAVANQEDFAPLNDFYFHLGMPEVANGGDVGWGTGGHQLSVSLTAQMTESGFQYLSLSFDVWPTAGSELY